MASKIFYVISVGRGNNNEDHAQLKLDVGLSLAIYILNSLHQENLVGAVKENSFTTYCAFEKGRNNNKNYRLFCSLLLITAEKKFTRS